MREYTPDKWVIVEMNMEGEIVHKVLASFFGGYLDGDSWKLSSGTVETEEDENYYIFKQHSGSTYKCHKKMEGLSMLTGSMLGSWQEQIKDKEGWSMEVVPKTIEEEDDQ